MTYRSLPFFSLVVLLSALPANVLAEMTTLYLLNGTVVRGEIVDRSEKVIDLKTPSGPVKVKTSLLMPISRQQLRLPVDTEKDASTTPAMEAIISQMEKILIENETLKRQISSLKVQLVKTLAVAPGNPLPPAEGPTGSEKETGGRTASDVAPRGSR